MKPALNGPSTCKHTYVAEFTCIYLTLLNINLQIKEAIREVSVSIHTKINDETAQRFR